jgi:hypothetical protein
LQGHLLVLSQGTNTICISLCRANGRLESASVDLGHLFIRVACILAVTLEVEAIADFDIAAGGRSEFGAERESEYGGSKSSELHIVDFGRRVCVKSSTGSVRIEDFEVKTDEQ